MRHTLLALMLITGTALAADLDTRHFYVTNNVSSARPAVSPLRWYAGESVKLDLYVKRGTAPLDLSASGLYPRWEVFMESDQSSAYIMATGTIASATNGCVTFALTPALANLPADEYVSYVKLYQPVGGTNTYVGMAYKTDLQVYWSPSSTNFVYQGPYTNSTAPVTRILAGSGVTLSPTTGLGDVTITATGGGGGGGTTNHAALINLDYASSGHTGFQPTIAGTVATNGSPLSVFVDDVGYLTAGAVILKNGTVAFTGNQSFGGYDATGVDSIFGTNGFYQIDMKRAILNANNSVASIKWADFELYYSTLVPYASAIRMSWGASPTFYGDWSWSDGNLSMGGNSITNVADPVADQDVVTKAYHDAHADLTWQAHGGAIPTNGVFSGTNTVGWTLGGTNYYILLAE